MTSEQITAMLIAEQKTITALENRHLNQKRNNIYIALEELDFIWSEREVINFKIMWDTGMDIKKIANVLKRPIDDVFILAYDQAIKGKIKPRKKGLMG